MSSFRVPSAATRSPSASSRPSSGKQGVPGSPLTHNSAQAAGAGQGSNGTLAEQVAQLKKQFADLEADTRSSQDSTQQTIKQNRQQWLALKQQNKEMKAELANRGGTTGRDMSKNQVEKTIEKLEKEVHELRRQYDKLMQEKKTALSKLENLQDSARELNKATTGLRPVSGGAAPAAADSKEARALRQLENRLDKALIKVNEAQSIRRTYEQVLEKLKEEAVGFDPHIRNLEETIKAKAAEHDAAIVANREAQHAKEVAKQELAALEAQVAKERASRQAVLSEQRAATQTLGLANKALLTRQFGEGQAAASIAGAAGAGGAEGAAEVPEVSSEEEAVTQLCKAVAAASVGAMLDRVLPQQETHENLVSMQAAAKRQEAEVSSQLRHLQARLEDLRSGRHGGTQAAMDAAQGELQEVTKVADAAKEAHDQVLHVYVDVRSGLEHLATMVSPLPLPAGQLPVPVSEETLGDVLAQCQLRLVGAQAFIRTLPKAAALLDSVTSNPAFSFSTAGEGVL